VKKKSFMTQNIFISGKKNSSSVKTMQGACATILSLLAKVQLHNYIGWHKLLPVKQR
jgi:hypothetical protein